MRAQKSTIRFDAVVQGGQRFAMGCAEIQESRVRSYTERLFPQPEILLIHAALLLFQTATSNDAHQARVSL